MAKQSYSSTHNERWHGQNCGTNFRFRPLYHQRTNSLDVSLCAVQYQVRRLQNAQKSVQCRKSNLDSPAVQSVARTQSWRLHRKHIYGCCSNVRGSRTAMRFLHETAQACFLSVFLKCEAFHPLCFNRWWPHTFSWTHLCRVSGSYLARGQTLWTSTLKPRSLWTHPYCFMTEWRARLRSEIWRRRAKGWQKRWCWLEQGFKGKRGPEENKP